MTHTNVGIAQTIGRVIGTILASVIALAALPILLVIAVLGSVAITIVAVAKAVIKAGKSTKPVAASPARTQSESAKPQPLVVKPIDYNTFPYGRDDIGGSC